MDRAIARKPRWRRYAIFAALAILAGGAGVWALRGAGGNVYRVPINRLTIGTVTQGPFEDYIAVRGAVAPFIIDYLTTDQGGTVKQVLVEDGARVKGGQPLIVLSNPALQLQVAAQQQEKHGPPGQQPVPCGLQSTVEDFVLLSQPGQLV